MTNSGRSARILVVDPEAFELGIEPLAAEAEHFGGRCAVVVGDLERGFDAEFLDQIGAVADDILERDAADKTCEFADAAGQFLADLGPGLEAAGDGAHGYAIGGAAFTRGGHGGNLYRIFRAIAAAQDRGEIAN